jgi:polar amino acid transport system substrate-binding protein
MQTKSLGRCALVFAAVAFTCPSASAIDLLTEENYPFSFSKSGKLVGSAVDVVTEVGKRANVPITIKSGDWVSQYKRAQVDPDTCIFSVARLPDRENLFKWVGVVAQNKWSVFSAPDNTSKISSIEDLRPFKIGVVDGDAKESYLKGKSITPHREFDNPEKAAQGLYAPIGSPIRVDFWVAGTYEAPKLARTLKKPPPKELLVLHEVNLFLACSTRTATATVDKLKSSLDGMRTDGTFARLSNPAAYFKD